MSPTGNSDIHEALADAMSSRPYTHRQDVDTGITAVITVEEDMRFLRSTLRSVLTQNVLPGVVIIAVMVVCSAILRFWQEWKANEATDSLMKW